MSEIKPPDPQSRTLPEIAALTGVPIWHLTQAAKAGAISKDGNKRYALGPTLVAIIKYQHAERAKLPAYSSIAQCALATGIPETRIKTAKKADKSIVGAGNMIHLGPLLRALFTGGIEDEEDWAKMRLRGQAIQEDVEAKIALEETLEKEKVGWSIRKAVALFFSTLERGIEIELPPELKGRDEAASAAEIFMLRAPPE